MLGSFFSIFFFLRFEMQSIQEKRPTAAQSCIVVLVKSHRQTRRDLFVWAICDMLQDLEIERKKTKSNLITVNMSSAIATNENQRSAPLHRIMWINWESIEKRRKNYVRD